MMVAIAIVVSGVVLAQASDDIGAKFRFGLGLSSLAGERCQGLRTGPAFDQMMSFLRAGAKSKGVSFDETAFLKGARTEAENLLAKKGKDVCAAAREVARKGGPIETAD